MAERESERKVQNEINKLIREREDAEGRDKAYQAKLVAELEKKFDEERNDLQTRKNTLINKLQDNHTLEINELREQLMN